MIEHQRLLSDDNGYTSALYKVMAVFAYQRSWIISGHSHFLLLRFLSLFFKDGKGVISESVSNKIDNSSELIDSCYKTER